MKICFIGTVASSIRNFRRDLILDLIEQGHEVSILATDFDSDSREFVHSIGAIPIDFNLSRAGLSPIQDIRSLIEIYRILSSRSFDVVFAYTVKPVIYGAIAAKLASVNRMVGMLEGLGYAFTVLPEGYTFRQKMVQLIQLTLYKVAGRYIDDLVFLNKDDLNDVNSRIEMAVPRMHVLGGIGVDLERYHPKPVPGGVLRFIFVGRLLREKGIFEYVACARKLKKEYSHLDFVVLGGIDDENPGALTRSELQLLVGTGDIIYPGYVSNVDSWVSDSSVFVLPSYREGVPMSAQEAAALGRAILTTDVPGCRDTVIDGYNGFLVEPHSSESLEKGMLKFIETPELANSMGVNSRKFAEDNFDVRWANDTLIKVLTSPKSR